MLRELLSFDLFSLNLFPSSSKCNVKVTSTSFPARVTVIEIYLSQDCTQFSFFLSLMSNSTSNNFYFTNSAGDGGVFGWDLRRKLTSRLSCYFIKVDAKTYFLYG
jgi:hypothetical protein